MQIESRKKFFLYLYLKKRRDFFYNINYLKFYFYNFINTKSEKSLLYGLQRSGTNIVRKVLIDNKINIINPMDLPPNSIYNRHFRFRENQIPTKSLSEYFIQTEKLKDNFDINSLLLASKYKFLIVIREPEEWLSSICSWSSKNKWFELNKRDEAALLLDDYIKYYNFWLNYSLEPKSNIKFIIFKRDSWDINLEKLFNIHVNKKTYSNARLRGNKHFDPKIKPESYLINDKDAINLKSAKDIFSKILNKTND